MDWLPAVLSFLAGVLAGFTLRIQIEKRSSRDSSGSVQVGNRVGGDQAGRDIKK
jgi:hypothetical protein